MKLRLYILHTDVTESDFERFNEIQKEDILLSADELTGYSFSIKGDVPRGQLIIKGHIINGLTEEESLKADFAKLMERLLSNSLELDNVWKKIPSNYLEQVKNMIKTKYTNIDTSTTALNDNIAYLNQENLQKLKFWNQEFYNSVYRTVILELIYGDCTRLVVLEKAFIHSYRENISKYVSNGEFELIINEKKWENKKILNYISDKEVLGVPVDIFEGATPQTFKGELKGSNVLFNGFTPLLAGAGLIELPQLKKYNLNIPLNEIEEIPNKSGTKFNILEIPNVMKNILNWPKSAEIMNLWFKLPCRKMSKEEKEGVNLDKIPSEYINKTIFTMKWLESFERVKKAKAELLSNQVLWSENAQKAIKKRFEKFNIIESSSYIIDNSNLSIEELHKNWQFQYKKIGYSLGNFNEVDDLYGSLGNFGLYVAILKAEVNNNILHIKKIGLYMKDTYDFIDNQYLGHWNEKGMMITIAGKIIEDRFKNKGFNFDMGVADSFGNKDFQEYQNQNQKGGDLLLFSDVKTYLVKKEIKL